jgi:hypothetical protein
MFYPQVTSRSLSVGVTPTPFEFTTTPNYPLIFIQIFKISQGNQLNGSPPTEQARKRRNTKSILC